jgi:hypothetical protein
MRRSLKAPATLSFFNLEPLLRREAPCRRSPAGQKHGGTILLAGANRYPNYRPHMIQVNATSHAITFSRCRRAATRLAA